jgi:hypothetical protein
MNTSNTKYRTFGTIPKSNTKIVERGKIDGYRKTEKRKETKRNETKTKSNGICKV